MMSISEFYNFTIEEEEILLQLVRSHSDVIDCQRTDAAAMIDKKRAWKSVKIDYNQQCPYRPTWVLQEKYSNMEYELRRNGMQTEAHTSPAALAAKNEPHQEHWRMAEELPLSALQIAEPKLEIMDDHTDHGHTSSNESPANRRSPQAADNRNGIVARHPTTTTVSWRPKRRRSDSSRSSAYACCQSLKAMKRQRIENDMAMRAEAHEHLLFAQRMEHEARMQQIRLQSNLARINAKIAKLEYRRRRGMRKYGGGDASWSDDGNCE